ncbi:hypothetical protein EVAR_66324_1 [Eumeta japonica]|uniref:Uncharacterized protein n=1 Tax=Eumeta variegata TaxID=151549 RepID=A0A4C1Z4F8_EUMVA|nr:hypothetical protein EVAR_66324_1 [Eumeta japonica]
MAQSKLKVAIDSCHQFGDSVFDRRYEMSSGEAPVVRAPLSGGGPFALRPRVITTPRNDTKYCQIIERGAPCTVCTPGTRLGPYPAARVVIDVYVNWTSLFQASTAPLLEVHRPTVHSYFHDAKPRASSSDRRTDVPSEVDDAQLLLFSGMSRGLRRSSQWRTPRGRVFNSCNEIKTPDCSVYDSTAFDSTDIVG